MPSSLNALLVAWAVSLIILVGGTVLFELTHDPNASEQSSPQEPVENAASSLSTNKEGADPASASDTQTATKPDKADADEAMSQPEDAPSTMKQDMATGLTEPVENAADEPRQVTEVRGSLRVEADPALIEQSTLGPLPRISEDGKRPFEVYAAPAPQNAALPKIAIVITDLGMRSRMTRRVIAELPPGVTFAFSPYASNLIDWGEQSRRTGHEILLMVPMEPVNYPQNDPGPLSLLVSRSARENVNLLRSSLGRLTGYVGIVNHMGSRFTAASDSLRPVLDELQRRGLMLLDSRASRYSRAALMARELGIPTSFSNAYIDEDVNPGQIAEKLEMLENRARTYDYAVGMGRAYPVTIDAIKVWAAGLEERGFILVPITATANQQPLPRS